MKQGQRLADLVERVGKTSVSQFPLFLAEDGSVTGIFMKIRLGSRFDDCPGLGKMARAVCRDPFGRDIAEADLYRLIDNGGSRAVLDRFLRTLHLLNYLAQGSPWQPLGLPVSMALLGEVRDQHGKAFRTILDSLDIEPDRFVMVLPAELQQEPERLESIRANYRLHGFDTRFANH